MTDLPKRNMTWQTGVTQQECPTCNTSLAKSRGSIPGHYQGPVPYRNCLRCGGFGTILLLVRK